MTGSRTSVRRRHSRITARKPPSRAIVLNPTVRMSRPAITGRNQIVLRTLRGGMNARPTISRTTAPKPRSLVIVLKPTVRMSRPTITGQPRDSRTSGLNLTRQTIGRSSRVHNRIVQPTVRIVTNQLPSSRSVTTVLRRVRSSQLSGLRSVPLRPRPGQPTTGPQTTGLNPKHPNRKNRKRSARSGNAKTSRLPSNTTALWNLDVGADILKTFRMSVFFEPSVKG